MSFSKIEFEAIFNGVIDRYEHEDFLNVLPKFKKLLPNFPDCVLEQWAFRHRHNFLSDYWDLGFDKFEFSLHDFDNTKIYNEIGWKESVPIESWGDNLFVKKNHIVMQTWLAKYFFKEKSWPRPIIVLQVDQIRQFGTILFQKSFQLLEGHLRLAYMRSQIRNNIEEIPVTHKVWVVKIIANSFDCA
ncbi:hypothetical protein [Leptospira koniambonensis]|uniref:hypothetical protein n=1 Tax=Leptospira koniambonensis TaxID=2484950 RepID=UPI003EBDDD2D